MAAAEALEGDEVEDEEQDDGIDPNTVIIIDNGTGMCKAGLSTDTLPRVNIPEAVGRPRPAFRDQLECTSYFGEELTSRAGQLSVNYFMENGIIENMEDMQELWEHVFYDGLQANPSRHPVLLTEPPFNPKAEREKMAEIMFETFEVPELNISVQGVLALLGTGRTTGIVLDSGEGVTHTIPVYDGYGLISSIGRSDVAGRELNTLLAKLLAQEGVSLTKTKEQQWLREIKEKHCYVALDPDLEHATPKKHRLPDGRELTLRDEMWRTPEALFSPAMCGFEAESCPGVARMVWDSVGGLDTRTKLLSNVVLSGGSTMFPGFAQRLERELRDCAPSAAQGKIRVVENDGAQNMAVWQGALAFAGLRSMETTLDQWITMEEWFEIGPEHLHSKLAVRFS